MSHAPRFDPFEAPLRSGRLVRRYKRFLADIVLDDGTEVTAHCPNSGSMLGLDAPDNPCRVRPVDDPRRKLKWTWELVSPDDGTTWVGINTQRPNDAVEWAIREGSVPGLPVGTALRREVRYGTNSRIDLLLGDEGMGRTYVEVKNTTLASHDPGVADRLEGPDRSGVALFPDAVTARGAKHMDELAAVRDAGHEAVVVFFVNRSDCDRFAVARDMDPAYGAAFDRAVAAGVRMVPLGMDVGPRGWRVRGGLPGPGE